VRFVDVVRRYPGPHGDVVAVDDLNLAIDVGEVFSLLGPNGAGKTTSIEMMVGLRRPSSGTVRTLGFDPVRQRDELRSRVSVQPQHAAVFEQQSVGELLRTWASFYPAPDHPDAVIERLGLQSARDVRVAKLSGGQRQRLLVGLALISRPRLLVLDEPSTGMDPNAREELWHSIRDFRASGGTVVMSTHSMEEAETLSDRLAILSGGTLVAAGSPEELVARYAPEREIVFTAGADGDLSWLQARADVLEMSTQERRGDTRVKLRTTDSDRVFAAVQQRVQVSSIHVRDAGLEAVFRRVTGHDAGEGEPGREFAAAGTPGRES
jgi:ABC-2 type transport system ATP-binding protein